MKCLEPPHITHSNFDSLLSDCDTFQRTQFALISTFSASELDHLTDTTFSSLVKRLPDEKSLPGNLFIINCLLHLSPQKVPQLLDFLQTIPPSKNDDHIRFRALIFARLCKISDNSRVASELSKCRQRDLSLAVYFVSSLARESPKSILLNADLSLKIAKEALRNPNQNIATIGVTALSSFLDIILKKAGQDEFLKRARPLYNIKERKTSSFGRIQLWIILCKRKIYPGGSAKDFYQDLRNVIRASREGLRDLLLLAFALAAPMDRQLFEQDQLPFLKTQFENGVTGGQLRESAFEAFIELFRLFPLNFHESFILKILAQMLRSAPVCFFQLLSEPTFDVPRFIQPLTTIGVSLFTAEKVPEVFQRLPIATRAKYAADLLKRFTQTADPMVTLTFLARWEAVPHGEARFPFRAFLQSGDPRVRAAVPAPMLWHCDAERLPAHVSVLLTVALTDRDSRVRESVVAALSMPKVRRCLGAPSSVSCFETLVNDETFSVRRAVVQLLTHLKEVSSFEVLPILRRIVLDSMYILGSPKRGKLQAEIAQLLVILIPAAIELLPIYSSTICGFALTHFTAVRNYDATVFERKYFARLSVDLAKSVELIATYDVTQIVPNPRAFIDAFVNCLKRHDYKTVKLAIMDALSVLISRSPKSVNRAALFVEISTITTEWRSKKLNEAFLKLLGLLGASDFAPPDPDDTEIDPQSYIFQKPTQVLLDVLSDPSLDVHRIHVFQTFVAMLHSYQQKEAPDEITSAASRFIPLLISEIRLRRTPTLIQLMISLCSNNESNWLSPFVSSLMDLIRDLSTTSCLSDLLGLIPVLADVLKNEFVIYAPQSVSLLLVSLEANRRSASEISITVLRSFVIICSVASDSHVITNYHHWILHGIVAAISDPEAHGHVRRLALSALAWMISTYGWVDHAAAVCQCALLYLAQPVAREPALHVLACLAHAVQRQSPQVAELLRPLIAPAFERLSPDAFAGQQRLPAELRTASAKARDARALAEPTALAEKARFDAPDTPWNRKEWFNQFVLAVVAHSPHHWIRAVAEHLVCELPRIAHELFDVAFLTCWDRLPRQSDARERIRSELTNALFSPNFAPESKLAVVNLVEFLDRARQPLDIAPLKMFSICRAGGHLAKAWYFANRSHQDSPRREHQQALVEVAGSLQMAATVNGLSAVFALPEASLHDSLGYWLNAGAEADAADVWRLLRQVRWREVADHRTRTMTVSVAKCMATANLMLERYEKVAELLQFCDMGDTTSLLFAAIAKDKLGDRRSALDALDSAFRILGGLAKTSFRPDPTVLSALIVEAMRLVECREFILNEYNPEVGRARLKLSPRLLTAYRAITAVRLQYVDRLDQFLVLLKCALKSSNWEYFDGLLQIMTPESLADPTVRLFQARAMWERGRADAARAIIAGLAPPSANAHLASKICYFKWTWTRAHLPTLIMATTHNPNYYKAWYRWGWVASGLFERDHTDNAAAMDAIRAFHECLRLRPRASFPELIAIITILFAGDLTADNARAGAALLAGLDDRLLLRAAPQLLTKLGALAFVDALVAELLGRHFHVLLYPLLLQQPASSALLDGFAAANPRALAQARTVRDGLLACSSPLFDTWLSFLARLPDRALVPAMAEALGRPPASPGDVLFHRLYGADLRALVEAAGALPSLRAQLERIPLPHFAPQLCALTNSVLAVPGTYEIGRAVVTIAHFAQSIAIAGRRRRVVVVGSDGVEYALELKCRADLRLDQYVMQFFELTNMHIGNCFPKDRRALKIHCYSITPLSKTCGLLQAIPRVQAMGEMIAAYRRRENPELAVARMRYLADVGKLTGLQRLEYNVDVEREVPDGDLREAIWLRTGSSQAWLMKTLRFIRTTAIGSIVGYVVGLGNRRPSNILIGQQTGDTIHIELGGCFEAAARRLRWPEVVPFRLTRMMRAAFGAAGVEGEFRVTAELMMKIVRSHQESSMAVLGIFRQDRLLAGEDVLEVNEEDGSILRLNVREALYRIQQKVSGRDCETLELLSVEEQVGRLIEEATNKVNLAKMPISWFPVW